VFWVTATFSIFAYLWLVLIVQASRTRGLTRIAVAVMGKDVLNYDGKLFHVVVLV